MENWRQYLEEGDPEQLDESFKTKAVALATAAGIAFMTAFPASAQAGQSDLVVTMAKEYGGSSGGPVSSPQYQEMFSQALIKSLEGTGMKVYDNTNTAFFFAQQAKARGVSPDDYMDAAEEAASDYGAAGIANAINSNILDIKFSYVKGKDNASSGTKATLTLVNSDGRMIDKEMGFIPNTGDSWQIVQKMTDDLVEEFNLDSPPSPSQGTRRGDQPAQSP